VTTDSGAPADILGTTSTALRGQLEFLKTLFRDTNIEINWREQSDESDPAVALLMLGGITVSEGTPTRRLNLRITAEQHGWRIDVYNENLPWTIKIS
jgi:hypothetical protein